jgi:hypothetical protein
VNLIFGFKQQTGMSSNQMVRSFVSQLESVGKVVSYKQPEKIPDQRKVLCVETIEEKNGKKYHVLYSFNWWDDGDLLFYSSAGSLDEEWCNYEKIFNTITQAIDIIDFDNIQRSKK